MATSAWNNAANAIKVIIGNVTYRCTAVTIEHNTYGPSFIKAEIFECKVHQKISVPDLPDFLAAIVANPEADSPLLILSDFLEDQGCAAESEALRVLVSNRRKLQPESISL